jgi:hypothetical protein
MLLFKKILLLTIEPPTIPALMVPTVPAHIVVIPRRRDVADCFAAAAAHPVPDLSHFVYIRVEVLRFGTFFNVNFFCLLRLGVQSAFIWLCSDVVLSNCSTVGENIPNLQVFRGFRKPLQLVCIMEVSN